MEHTEAQNKKLDKEISKAQQDMGSLQEANPIQIGVKPTSDKSLVMQELIVKTLVDKLADWENWRKPKDNMWDQIYRLFFNKDGQATLPTRAKIFVPMIFKIVESGVPLITNTIFSSENLFDVVPTNPKDADIAELIKILLTYQLGQANFFPKFIDFVKQLCLYGTSYFKVYWKVTRKWVWERTPIREDVNLFGIKLPAKITGWKEEKKYKVTERRPEIDVLDVLDVFPDPSAANEREGEGVFIRTWMSAEDLREMGAGKIPVFANTDKPAVTAKNKSSVDTSRSNRLTTRGLSSVLPTKARGVEVIEWWGKYDLDGDGIREECYIVIANRSVLLKAVSNPFHHQKRPIVRSVLFNVPMEWYGIGLVEPIMDQQHELNTVRRQRLDNVNMVLNRMWKVLDTGDVDTTQLMSAPGHYLLVGQMDALEPLETKDVTQTAYQEAGALMQEMHDATVSRGASGNPESGRLGRTASGARLLVGQSLEKFSLAIRLIEETAVKRTLRMMHQLNLQMIDDDDVLRDPGMYGHLFDQDMTPEAIRAEVRFEMKAASEMISSEAKINQLASFLGMSKDVLEGSSISEVLKMIWKLMGFDPDKIKLTGQTAPPIPPAGGPLPAGDGGTSPDDALANEIARNGAESPPSAIRPVPPTVQ